MHDCVNELLEQPLYVILIVVIYHLQTNICYLIYIV